MILITAKQIRQIIPNMSIQRAIEMEDHINFVCPTRGINTKDIFHEFFANVAHESGGFRLKSEIMDYRAARIVQVWPNRFALPVKGVLPKGKINALHFEHNPVALANMTYGNRMGNRPDTNDGYDNRGGGYMGLTGREIYLAYQKDTGFDTLKKLADAVRTDEYYAMDSAAWVFAVKLKLIPLAIADNMMGIVSKINGGLIGLNSRNEFFRLTLKYAA